MSVEQAVTEFLKDHPVDFLYEDQLGRSEGRLTGMPSRVEVREGRLVFTHGVTLKSLGNAALWAIRAHEIGHVVAATDEELFAPNLGLSTLRIPGDTIPRELVVRTETMAMTSMVLFMRAAGASEKNLHQQYCVVKTFFDLKRKEIERFMKDWTMDRLQEAFTAQMNKITEAHNG